MRWVPQVALSFDVVSVTIYLPCQNECTVLLSVRYNLLLYKVRDCC